MSGYELAGLQLAQNSNVERALLSLYLYNVVTFHRSNLL